MIEQLLETWSIHDRINRYLLDAVLPETLSDVSASKGRNVGEQFAHIHNVRFIWLKAAFLGYLISHESHHRGQIVLTLKQAGHPVDKKTQFGIWEWGVR